ncbi:prephenate dehydratase domain-containing protein [Clostridium sp. ZS2-4]|uniref:prephenate dehydratase domain-containing protein n=1 Tax=Clostridium sp. ZS2-4 TaxID=2987703 RepID=UPI00227CE4DD|nr:prephenate dehydratase domain-containing protein [Clostridium sp. ZS2-4]MCY6355334.1 hypothetical protein [Clostridium sp. ZS2-4]
MNSLKNCLSNVNPFIDICYDEKEINSILRDDYIQKIYVFALGPEGTNISQAAEKWIVDKELSNKAEIILCSSPEEAIEKAKEISHSRILPVFTLCAVYNKLFELYFSNTDSYFFMDHIYMKLDNMIIATNEYQDKDKYKIFSHPSPSILVDNLENIEVVYSNSNAFAAQRCKEEIGELCITTESARVFNGLKAVHCIGAPVMLFTFGTTLHGIKILNKIGGGQ